MEEFSKNLNILQGWTQQSYSPCNSIQSSIFGLACNLISSCHELHPRLASKAQALFYFFHEMTCFITLSAWINFSSTPPKNSFQPTLFNPPFSNSCCVTRFNHSHGRHCSSLTRVNRRLFVKIYLNPQSHWDEMLPFIQTWALSGSGRVSTPAICEAAGEEHQ